MSVRTSTATSVLALMSMLPNPTLASTDRPVGDCVDPDPDFAGADAGRQSATGGVAGDADRPIPERVAGFDPDRGKHTGAVAGGGQQQR